MFRNLFKVFSIILILIVFLAVSIFYKIEPNDNYNSKNVYNDIKNSLNIEKPGFGVSDYGNNDLADIPKAHAMFLSSELIKSKQINNYDLTMAINSGNWLLNNKDLNNNGIIGWGVPISWDAFGDKSINEKDAEYTISTGIVINSLLDWLDHAPSSAPKDEIINAVKKSILPYINDEIFSSSGLFNYSLKIEDRKYNCFNAAIYMAGQMQRFTRYISDEDLISKIKNSTDKVMAAALKYRKIDPNGGWYWSYSIEEDNTPNDMAHAMYIIDGIINYSNSGGNLSNLFEKKLLIKHINFFHDENYTNWYFYPSFFNGEIKPRTYGIGMLLYVYAKYTDNNIAINNLIKYIDNYKVDKLYSRWQNESIIINEYLIYLLYGLSHCEANTYIHNLIHPKSDSEHLKNIKSKIDTIKLEEIIELPLIDFKIPNIRVKFSLEELNTIVSIKNVDVLLKHKSVPVKILENDIYYFLINRELFTNRLILSVIDKKALNIQYYNIDYSNKDSFLDFRNAILDGDTLVLVAYESTLQQNTLILYDLKENFSIKTKLKLPSLEDPAGKTYEVIPKIELLTSTNGLYIVGGRMIVNYSDNQLTVKNVPADIEVFLEALVGEDKNLYVIYRDKSSNYGVKNISNDSNIYLSTTGEIIFGLSYFRDSIKFRILSDNNTLKELFEYDFINNKGDGSLYLGTNNIEGWSSWAQVYYLNGMMSFIELCMQDIHFYKTFENYFEPIIIRLKLEMYLLTKQLESNDGLRVRVFTVDRSLSTFAVQSSRFAMLFERYMNLFPSDYNRTIFNNFFNNVKNLNNHMEELHKGYSNVVNAQWNSNDNYYLKWPKGNKFYFDGLNVPYNHQNEWATYLINNTTEKYNTEIGVSIVELFLNNITNNLQNENLPQNAIWPYWWAKAYDGYSEDEHISINKSSYVGDKANGWISFRTIDAISVLSLIQYYNKNNLDYNINYLHNIIDFTANGELYPFTSTYLKSFDSIPMLNDNVMNKYIRFSSPWEFDNVVYSYLSYINKYE